MKILSLIHLYPPHHLGGYEVACRGVMERFQERGHEVVVLTSDTKLEGVDDTTERPGVEVWRRLKMWWDWETFASLLPTLRQRVDIERTNERVFREALKAVEPDVISIWSLGYLSFSLATIAEQEGIPLVLSLLDDWLCYAYVFDAWTRIFDRRPWASPLGRMLGLTTRLPSFEGATVSVASQFIGQQLGNYSRWDVTGAPVVHLGVETRDFPITGPAHDALDWAWRLLYVGRVVPQKGIETLVRALAHLDRDARVDVDGHADVKESEALMDLADSLGVADRVVLRRSPRADLRSRYRNADVVVYPTQWQEPFGLVPLEAMACGVPVLATGTGGSGEYLRHEDNCLLFEPRDDAGLAAAVRSLAEQPELRMRLVEGGFRTARELTMDRYADASEGLHLSAFSASPRVR